LDLVEKEDAALRLAEKALSSLDRASEGPLHMAKQEALGKSRIQSAARKRYDLFPPLQREDSLLDQSRLAGSAFSKYKQGCASDLSVAFEPLKRLAARSRACLGVVGGQPGWKLAPFSNLG